MSFQFTLQKVLEMKDYEKSDAELAFTDSVKEFEEIALNLYELMKRKETLIVENNRKLETGLSISMIQWNEQTIAFIQKEIDRLQKLTQKARKNMNEKERYLNFKSVDLKKYQKLKEIKFDEYLHHEKQEEQRFLDEISVQQFVRR